MYREPGSPAMSTTEELLLSRRRGLAVTMVFGFAAAVALALVVALVADLAGLPAASALTDRIVPLLVFYAPGPIAAAGAYARCGGPACLAVGVVPALVFGALVIAGTVFGVPGVGGGSTLGGTALSFGLVGLSGAFVGYCAGVSAVLLADLIGAGVATDRSDGD